MSNAIASKFKKIYFLPIYISVCLCNTEKLIFLGPIYLKKRVIIITSICNKNKFEIFIKKTNTQLNWLIINEKPRKKIFSIENKNKICICLYIFICLY